MKLKYKVNPTTKIKNSYSDTIRGISVAFFRESLRSSYKDVERNHFQTRNVGFRVYWELE